MFRKLKRGLKDQIGERGFTKGGETKGDGRIPKKVAGEDKMAKKSK